MVLEKGVVLTKDNLARRNWNGSKTCSFCHYVETKKKRGVPSAVGSPHCAGSGSVETIRLFFLGMNLC